ncbi:MAG: curli-like amyloid fiber formation chaperone CsgH [Methyloceanibacter sp.]
MSPIVTFLTALALPVGIAWGAAGGGGASCDIRVDQSGQSVTLEGVVSAPTALAGSYELHVAQGGGGGDSDIHQSGEFEVGPGEESSLGTVSLSPGRYSATLTVHWDGGGTDCTRKVGDDTSL